MNNYRLLPIKFDPGNIIPYKIFNNKNFRWKVAL